MTPRTVRGAVIRAFLMSSALVVLFTILCLVGSAVVSSHHGGVRTDIADELTNGMDGHIAELYSSFGGSGLSGSESLGRSHVRHFTSYFSWSIDNSAELTVEEVSASIMEYIRARAARAQIFLRKDDQSKLVTTLNASNGSETARLYIVTDIRDNELMCEIVSVQW